MRVHDSTRVIYIIWPPSLSTILETLIAEQCSVDLAGSGSILNLASHSKHLVNPQMKYDAVYYKSYHEFQNTEFS